MKPSAITACLLIVPFLVGTVRGQNANWDEFHVTSGAGKPSLAVDSHGIPHIAYMLEASKGSVYYAIWNETDEAFINELVVEGYFYGPPAITTDSNDRPHINYHDHSTGNQQHVFLTDQGWENELIESGGHDGWDNSIVVDESGIVHTSTTDPSSGVEYARRSRGWTVEGVGTNPFSYGYGTSIALDPSGIPHIAYFDNSTGHLMLASRTAGWQIVEVDTEGDVGRFASLAIDANGKKHISYLRDLGDGSGLIEHAESDGDGWLFETIDKLDNVFAPVARNMTSLDLDGDGNPHVAYSDMKIVRYAHRSDGQWQRETLVDARATDRELGQLTSMKLDAQGVAHVTYYEIINRGPVMGDIYYARRKGAVGVAYEESDVPQTGMEIELYPNPAAARVQIGFVLETPSQVRITVHDVTGREISRLLDGLRPAGRYHLSFDGTDLPSGYYVVSGAFDERRSSRSLILTHR